MPGEERIAGLGGIESAASFDSRPMTARKQWSLPDPLALRPQPSFRRSVCVLQMAVTVAKATMTQVLW